MTIRVHRFDVVGLPKVTRSPEGYLRARGMKLGRIGVQEYAGPDGKTIRELRLDEDVFSEDAISSLDGQPITLDHQGILDADTVRQHMRGHVSSPRVDGDRQFIEGDLVIQDAAAVRAAQSTHQELSLGYEAILEPVPGGVFKQDGHPLDGTQADYIQRGIRHNHLALVNRGRANQGLFDRPVRIRMDSDLNHHLEAAAPPESDMEFITVKIGDTEIRVPKEDAGKLDKLTAQFDSASKAEKAAEEAKARADAAEAKLAELEEQGDTKAKQDAELARYALLDQAAKVLEKPLVELVPHSDADLRRTMLAKLDSEASIEGLSDEAIAGALHFALRAKAKADEASKADPATSTPRHDASSKIVESLLANTPKDIQGLSAKRTDAAVAYRNSLDWRAQQAATQKGQEG